MKTLNFETAPLGFNELKKDLPTATVKKVNNREILDTR